MAKRTIAPGKNIAVYNYTTGLYHNNSGSFLTLAEANAFAWKCEKCGSGFRSVVALHDHRDLTHSY